MPNENENNDNSVENLTARLEQLLASVEGFTAAIDECLDKLPTQHKAEMQSLMTHKFQTFGDVPLLAA